MKKHALAFLLSWFLLVKINGDKPEIIHHLYIYDTLEDCLEVRDPLQSLTLFHLYVCVETKSKEIPKLIESDEPGKMELRILEPGENFTKKKRR